MEPGMTCPIYGKKRLSFVAKLIPGGVIHGPSKNRHITVLVPKNANCKGLAPALHNGLKAL
jgi:hypothetical protein